MIGIAPPTDVTSEKRNASPPDQEALERERTELLHRLEDGLDKPMLILAFVWRALLVTELTWGERVPFTIFGTLIWVFFILDFAIGLVMAPRKRAYPKSPERAHWGLLVRASSIGGGENAA